MALVGRTGSGKSTLASLLSRAVEPPRGSVFLGGVDVRDLDLQRCAPRSGRDSADRDPLGHARGECRALRRRAAVGRRGRGARAAPRRVGGGLPDGLDTLLGPGGTSLSAGEEQLVAFARLLVRDVQVVVLDEATARMDP
ncbi:ATP-binding cassette domain-containing protein [Oerskovia sp. M15]